MFGLVLSSLFACGQPNGANEKQNAASPLLDRKAIANEVGLYMRTGDELLKNNKPKDAVNAYERGLKLLEKLEKLSPAPPASGQFPTLLAARFRYMRGLAQSQAKIANQLEAMRFWQQATDIAKNLFGDECDDAYACLSGYADAAMAAGDLDAARGALETIIAWDRKHLTPLQRKGSSIRDHKRCLVSALQRYADVLDRLGHPSRASDARAESDRWSNAQPVAFSLTREQEQMLFSLATSVCRHLLSIKYNGKDYRQAKAELYRQELSASGWDNLFAIEWFRTGKQGSALISVTIDRFSVSNPVKHASLPVTIKGKATIEERGKTHVEPFAFALLVGSNSEQPAIVTGIKELAPDRAR
ncbi:MAG TPA: hypothetical protein V6D08_13705 [Candidatus Obscuribacterales bacterium]